MSSVETHSRSETWVCAAHRCLRWLRLGVSDFRQRPFVGLAYGFGFFFVSCAVVGFLWATGLTWMLLPALAGAILIGPILAVGLYQEARRVKYKCHCRVASPGQFAVVGAILMVLLLTWFRSATVLYALFFGLRPFPGFIETIQTVLFTQEGIALLMVGTAVGGLFAALTLAVSFFSVPMMVDREIDAFSAMGLSFSTCTHNFKTATTWGFIVTLVLLMGFVTGLLAMIVAFPLLGYATWHAYDEMCGAVEQCV